jgi:AcrR family transcriptional regulator
VAGLLRDVGAGTRRIGMREVAERSGTSLATIYRRWPSREDLLFEAIARFFQEHEPIPDTGDLRSDLLAVLDIMRNRRAFVESLPGLIVEGAANPDFGKALRKILLGMTGRSLRTVCRRARARGRIPPAADLSLAADTAIALFAHQPLLYGRQPTRAYTTRIVDHALLPMLGLGIAGAPASRDGDADGE